MPATNNKTFKVGAENRTPGHGEKKVQKKCCWFI